MTNGSLATQCCIAGGGPAGMMLGYLLGRAGVNTVVLEKHADFLRDFRGDTVHPSTLLIMQELGLLDEFLKLPHSKIRRLERGDRRRASFKIADFGTLATPCNFVALMPQWDFLNFLADKGRRFPGFVRSHVGAGDSLIETARRVVGVRVRRRSALEVRADLVVGCDGRIRRYGRSPVCRPTI